MIQFDCPFGGRPHEYPDDWVLGGANNKHPGADPRLETRIYTYWSDKVEILWTTSIPICDDQAIDMFTWVANIGRGCNPTRISVRIGKNKEIMLPVIYDKSTDTAKDLVR